VIEMTFCAKVAADVVGTSKIIAMHARVVVQVDAPYKARRPYIPGESDTRFRIRKKNGVVGRATIDSARQLTSPEAISTEDKYWELKKTTGSEMQVRSDQGRGV
jgi:hypothetical protein